VDPLVRLPPLQRDSANDANGLTRTPTVAVSRKKGRPMLNAVLGMVAMVPVIFGVAGYTLVSR
jgi:hypothetical protein